MEQLDQDQQIQWRRDKVQELCSKGALQQRIRPKSDITTIASWISYGK
jgi:hypothetical protein